MIKIKKLLCKHEYKPINGYENEDKTYWVTVKRCVKCGKTVTEKDFYPPKCKITNKSCIHSDDPEFDNCRLCDVYEWRWYYYKINQKRRRMNR